MRGDPSLLLVHGMEDSLVSIDHTMQLSRVRSRRLVFIVITVILYRT